MLKLVYEPFMTPNIDVLSLALHILYGEIIARYLMRITFSISPAGLCDIALLGELLGDCIGICVHIYILIYIYSKTSLK